VCAVSVDGQSLLASAGADGTIGIWDPRTGVCVLTVPTYRTASAIAGVAESLAIGLNTGVLLIKPSAVI
jgi:WD40 repeat protein